MATIGQPLTAPEAGWKRYDDTHPLIRYTPSSWSVTNGAGAYNLTWHGTNISGTTISFSFVGTKLRIVGFQDSSYSNSINIVIDGATNTFSQNSATQQYQTLNFETIGLGNVRHDVTISNNTTSSYMIDAIDIDSTGRLIHPDEVTNINDLTIGKRIRCHYTAASGVFGTFSGLGLETSDFIPAASTATPNGDFYIIHVDNDYLGRKKLIADRNIQHSISWDVLNTAGVASGSGLPVKIDNNNETQKKYTTRLLTGGTSATDKDNEWDNYIVNSTLNGTITAGDNAVWNWNGLYSWTSTSISAANRVQRGSTAAAAYANAASNNVTPVYSGFRPVLIIEYIPQRKVFAKDGTDYKKYTDQWVTVSTTLPLSTTFQNEGMDISILNRSTKLFTQTMINDGVLGSGTKFKSTVDLRRFIELISMNVR